LINNYRNTSFITVFFYQKKIISITQIISGAQGAESTTERGFSVLCSTKVATDPS
tara:strand:+ start:423 stop:587 length:165 start_codon:yes stop_codon:yes gene_type:complete